MNDNFYPRTLEIPGAVFNVPMDEWAQTWVPLGNLRCLERINYYLGEELGFYQTFSIDIMRRIITDHRGYRNSQKPRPYIYVIGVNPDADFMESILGFNQIEHRQLWDFIDRSVYFDYMNIDDEQEDGINASEEEEEEDIYSDYDSDDNEEGNEEDDCGLNPNC